MAVEKEFAFTKHIKFNTIAVSCFVLFLLFITINCTQQQTAEQQKTTDSITQAVQKEIAVLFDRSIEWKAPDTTSIPSDGLGRLIHYGKLLITNTALYLGPKGSVSHSSNGMNCQNCHKDAGTRLYANSFSAVAATYPRFRPRSGALESVEKRVNDCMERSLNGKMLDSNSHEMRAMVAYIKWVGKDVKKGETPKGASVIDLPLLNRAADPEKGKLVYQQQCVRCHGADGSGKLNSDSTTYQYPPLWGPHSYNVSAGLYRLSRFAGYIKSNMPDLTSSYEKPMLTDEEAWDIAAFVNSMERPEKKFSKDYPDISKKPFDHPFGPYADNYSETQHKYGPFAEMPSAKKKK